MTDTDRCETMLIETMMKGKKIMSEDKTNVLDVIKTTIDRTRHRIHKTPEEVFELLHDGVPLNEIESVGGIDADGNECEIPTDDIIAGIREVGVWGFSDAAGNIIHFWRDEKCPDTTMVHFLAHEYGHIAMSCIENYDNIDEEQRCEIIGIIAAHVFEAITRWMVKK